eukprot:UN10562
MPVASAVLSLHRHLLHLPTGAQDNSVLQNNLPHLGSRKVHTYKDPLTEFLRCLFVESDFEAASEHLRECRKVLTVDIFLCSHCNVFSQARLLLFSICNGEYA